MAVDAENESELQKALNDSAGKASVLWTTFITFELYLAIAFGSVTHRDLLLETPIKLPVLNVELPLVGFFIVAPTLLVIFYFYVVLQLLALAKKTEQYDVLLREVAPVASDSRRLRERLDSFFILQFRAGPEDQRTGSSGFWLRLIAWITLVGAPIAILIQAQVTFLPYHKAWVLWLLRSSILFLLIIISSYWGRVVGPKRPPVRTLSSVVRRSIRAASQVFIASFCICVVTFPGEWADSFFPRISVVPMTWPPSWNKQDDWTTLHTLLFAGEINEITSRPTSPFSDRLVITDQSLINTENLDKTENSLSLRGRDLSYAVLSRTDLRKADFTGANLDFARLNNARLEGAKFACADDAGATDEDPGHPNFLPTSLKWPQDGCAWLRMIQLQESQLQAAKFARARMQGAKLFGANMTGANFTYARLQGAAMEHASLQAALLVGAKLQGASIERSQLWAANLSQANLELGSLFESQLQGTRFSDANLQGANLNGALIWHIRGTPSDWQSMTWGGRSYNSPESQISKKPFTGVEFVQWQAEVGKMRLRSSNDQFWDVSFDLQGVDPRRTTIDDGTPKKVWQDARRQDATASSTIVACACGSEASMQILGKAVYSKVELKKILSEMKSSNDCPGFSALGKDAFEQLGKDLPDEPETSSTTDENVHARKRGPSKNGLRKQ
jgi:uncharacterized protein YjbI with pentapeptide repeats